MPHARPVPPYPGLKILADETVWNGRFPVQRIRFQNRQFDGTTSGERTWELWRRGTAAALLPYDPVADMLILIEQFRLPALAADLDPVMVEIPAGLCDPGEDANTTLMREAEEEIGVRPRRLHPVGDFLLSPGGCDERVHIAIGEVTVPPHGADGIIGRAGLASENEDIQIRAWPAAAAIEQALAGKFANSVATIALLWFACRREWLRQHWSAAP
jgi:ADP-ribose pyrophosphatase